MGSLREIACGGALVLSITVIGGLACDPRQPLEVDPADAAGVVATSQGGATGMTPSTGAGGATGAGGSGAGGPVTPNDTPEVRQDLMARWNHAAVVPSNFNYNWPTFDLFPHPTFKGGSQEAYQVFSAVLANFFEADDNFAFLAKNHLFGLRLRYTFPSGQIGIDTSFAELAATFSSDGAYGNISAPVRARLAAISARIKQTM